MLRRRDLACFSVGWACIVLLTGCGGGELLGAKDEELQALRDKDTSSQQSLSESQVRIFKLQEGLRTARVERDDARQKLSESQHARRERKDESAKVSKERLKLAGKLLESERAYERLKKKLATVQVESSRMAEDFADYRLRKRELEERVEQLGSANVSLRDDTRTLTTELDKTLLELKKEQAVNRSVLPGQHERSTVLKERIQDLEGRTQGLQDEKVALLKRLEVMKSKLPAGVAEDLAGVTGKGVYQEDPGGLGSEITGFLGARYGRMFEGKASWGAVDIGLVVGGFGFCFLVFWIASTPRRWKKKKKLRWELKNLRARLKEVSSREAGEGTVRPKRSRQRQGSVVRRSGQFSPIISGDVVHEEEEEEQEEYYDYGAPAKEVLEEVSPVAPPAAPRSSGGAARGSQVIGARQWLEDATDPADQGDVAEDEFVHTQVISASNVGLEFPGDTAAEDVDRDPLRSARSQAPAAGDAEEEDEFGHTQIISSLHGLDALDSEAGVLGGPQAPVQKSPPARDKKKGAGSSNEDLMNELEDLIGKKVDELIQ